MQLKLYSGFSKRINSTKRPGNATITLDGNLREPCSIENPVIQIVPMSLVTAPAAYSYAYIPDFSRYYFVSDWSYNNGLWECSLTEDYLATWKTNIGNTNAYIDRCASEYDGNIIDTQYITTTDYEIISRQLDFYWNYDGCFVVGIIDGKNDNNAQIGGAVTYYVLTKVECKALMSYLMSPAFLSANGFPASQSITQQLSQETAKAFVNPFQFITSCIWLPFDTPVLTGNASSVSISVGYWLIDAQIVTGKLLSVYTLSHGEVVEMPTHPQAATRGDYLNFSPYTRLSLFVPPFGIMPIDPMYRKLGNYIHCMMNIDPITGIADLCVHVAEHSSGINYDTAPVIYEASATIGIPIQIAQVGNDFIGAASSAVQAIASIDFLGGSIGLMTGGIGGAIKGAMNSNVISNAANAIMSLMPQVQTKGANGCRTYVSLTPRLKAEFMKLVDEDNAEMGRPLRKIRKINTLSGFIKCYEVTVDYPCFDSEKASIYDYLINGFFWE